ncbi:exosortase family protein XrtF [Seonamhaeicola sp. ML3]|uniref:exosortase family protein XrtF n=1 Tax=Seonamhaeicola sp. ML3 TaxID=2937786 RepID=UPI00200FF50D|nr:exosortase family protein XrtF [Seonamhaeicola sp. ML3]
MRALFVKYKAVVKFIITFLLVYIVLSFLYSLFLDLSDGSKFYPDYITNLVAKQTEALIETFGYHVEMIPHANEPSIKIVLNGNYLGRVVEGCNAFSVIILFVSFVIAFSGKFKATILFMLCGSVLLYSVNLIRIALLSIGLFHYPQHEHVLHTIVFPAIIYGMMFLLWFYWVNRFSKSSRHE